MNSKDHHDICKQIKNITLDNALKDYNNLKYNKYMPQSKIGNKSMDYFFF